MYNIYLSWGASCCALAKRLRCFFHAMLLHYLLKRANIARTSLLWSQKSWSASRYTRRSLATPCAKNRKRSPRLVLELLYKHLALEGSRVEWNGYVSFTVFSSSGFKLRIIFLRTVEKVCRSFSSFHKNLHSFFSKIYSYLHRHMKRLRNRNLILHEPE